MAQFVFGPAPQVKIGRQGLTHGTGGALPPLPPCYAFRVDYDGKYITDPSGNYEVEPV